MSDPQRIIETDQIYVASSWKNTKQPGIVKSLREAGLNVYDFRNPAPGNNGFDWKEVDPSWTSWTPEQSRKAYSDPVALEGFHFDMEALMKAWACVLVCPCGRSAHLELGYAVGAQKLTIILLESGEPELMYSMVNHICLSLDEVIHILKEEAQERGKLRERGTLRTNGTQDGVK